MSKGAVSAVKPETVLRGHKDSVNCIAFVSDEILSSGSMDGVLKLWSLNSRRALTSIDAHDSSILSVNSLLSSSSMLTCGRDGFSKLWRIDGESFSAITSPYLSIDTGSRHFCNSTCDRGHLSDSNMILTPSAEESEISVWDLRAASKRIAVVKQDRKDQLGGGQVAERGMVFSLLLQSQYGNGNSATKKNCSNLENEDAVKIQESVASGSILSTSVPRFVAGYEDGSISCFDLRTFRPVCSIKPHEEPVMAMDLSPNGGSIVSGGGGNILARTVLKSEIKVPSHKQETASPTPSVSSALTGIMKMSVANEIQDHKNIVGMQSVFLEDQDSFLLPSKGTSCVRHRSDGRIIVSGHWDNSFRIYDTKRMKPLAVIRHHRDKVYAVDFAPSFEDSGNRDSRPGLFATGSKDSTIAVWSVFEETIK